jgi:hypothetical protein
MKSSEYDIENPKSKKELQNELDIYEEFIEKKIENEDLNSAREKTSSALTLIEEYSEYFDLKQELKKFKGISSKLEQLLKKYRDKYKFKFQNLLKENVDENNLESLTKLLAILKEDIEENLNKYTLYDINDEINHCFECIKRLYAIISSFETSTYEYISENLMKLKKEVKNHQFDNLLPIILTIHQKIINRKLNELANKYQKLSITELSEKLKLSEEETTDFISKIMKKEKTPIRLLNYTNKEVLFNSSNIFDV